MPHTRSSEPCEGQVPKDARRYLEKIVRGQQPLWKLCWSIRHICVELCLVHMQVKNAIEFKCCHTLTWQIGKLGPMFLVSWLLLRERRFFLCFVTWRYHVDETGGQWSSSYAIT